MVQPHPMAGRGSNRILGPISVQKRLVVRKYANSQAVGAGWRFCVSVNLTSSE